MRQRVVRRPCGPILEGEAAGGDVLCLRGRCASEGYSTHMLCSVTAAKVRGRIAGCETASLSEEGDRWQGCLAHHIQHMSFSRS